MKKAKQIKILLMLCTALIVTLLCCKVAYAQQASVVWVNLEYCEGCSNDGHTWGYDAFTKIQEGIDNAASPGTVHVAAGMYTENITMKNSVNVVGAGPDLTVIDGGGTGTVVTFGWLGEDEDGAVVGYEYQNVTGDTTSAGWIATTDTTVTFDLSASAAASVRRGRQLGPLNLYRDYTFYLRAVDNENKRSNVIRAPYTSGPENLPPTVAFLLTPGDTVTGAATWTWQGTDADGEILGYQWAFDPVSEEDWDMLAPEVTTFHRVFTREEGSPEAPGSFTFHLRAQDSDSVYSAPITHSFTVAVPNAPPRVQFLSPPSPTTPVGYVFTIRWSGSDDGVIAAYEYAVDDAGWTALAGNVTSQTLLYSCADSVALEASPNPAAPLAWATVSGMSSGPIVVGDSVASASKIASAFSPNRRSPGLTDDDRSVLGIIDAEAKPRAFFGRVERMARQLDLRPPGADRLDFPAFQDEARLEAFLDEVVVEGLLVVNNAHDGFALEFA